MARQTLITRNAPAAARNRRPAAVAGFAPGFTLVELMISVAIALLLIIAINEIFRRTTQVISAGQSISTAVRDQRAVRQVMQADFDAMVLEGAPFFSLRMQSVPAYRNLLDMQQEGRRPGGNLPGTDYVAGNEANILKITSDLNNGATDSSGNAVATTVSAATYGGRNHRTDLLTFFTRAPQTRQTGDINFYISPGSSGESEVCYGHLRLPANPTDARAINPLDPKSPVNGGTGGYFFFDPGEPDWTGGSTGARNENNGVASQFILGRSVMLLQPVGSATTPVAFRGGFGNSGYSQLSLAPLAASSRTPVVASSTANYTGTYYSTGTTYQYPSTGVDNQYVWPFQSRFDVADTSINGFASTMAGFQRNLEFLAATVSNFTTTGDNKFNYVGWFNAPNLTPLQPLAKGSDNKYKSLTAVQGLGNSVVYRRQALPFVLRPQTPQSVALTSPIFVPRCSQFIVEYAGDFVTQDGPTSLNPKYWGRVSAALPDGEVDFVIVNGVKKIRWYGLPRNTDAGDDNVGTVSPAGAVICGDSGGANSLGADNKLRDVMPLYHFLLATLGARGTSVAPYPFEKQVDPNTSSTTISDWSDITKWRYGNSRLPPINYANPADGRAYAPAEHVYNCMWTGSDLKPKLVRVTLTLEDSDDRSSTGGNTYEYVFSLP